MKENPQKWVPFLAKITLKDGYGFWGGERHTPVQLNEYPPG